MSTATYAGVSVELNDEGFFLDPTQWTREIAAELAKADGIDELTAQHERDQATIKALEEKIENMKSVCFTAMSSISLVAADARVALALVGE